MKIYGSLMDSIRPAGPGGVTPPPARDDAPAQPVAPVSPVSSRSDSVEISQRGRSLAGMAETDPERVAELRTELAEVQRAGSVQLAYAPRHVTSQLDSTR